MLEKSQSDISQNDNLRISFVKQEMHCPFEGCPKLSAEASNLKTHLRSHLKTKDFKCNFAKCGRKFKLN